MATQERPLSTMTANRDILMVCVVFAEHEISGVIYML